jgi:hypothetical protein
MPRSRNNKTNQAQITRVPFRVTHTSAATADSSTPVISEVNLVVANLGDRIAAIADTFAYWRLVSLRAYTSVVGTGSAGHPGDSSVIQAIAFTPLPPADYAAPTSIATMVDMVRFHFGNGFDRLQISMSQADLLGSIGPKWLQTSTVEATPFQNAGTLTFYIANSFTVSGNNHTGNVIIEGVVEFKNPMDTANISLSALEARVAIQSRMLESRRMMIKESDEEKKDVRPKRR